VLASWSPQAFAPSKADRALLVPGTRVTSENVERYAAYLSPATRWLVGAGGIGAIEVGEYRPASLPPPLIDATRQYACHVALKPEGLEGYMAGLPFPVVGKDDPDAAAKLMWNHDVAGAFDDLKVGAVVCWTGAIDSGQASGSLQIEETFRMEAFRQLRMVGRLMVAPRPLMVPNRDAAWEKTEIYPMIEPDYLKGTSISWVRYVDAKRMPDTWLYLPQLRRVRRLSAAQRSDALFGQDLDLDSLGGFAGPVSWTEWKYLGERTLLAPFHMAQTPVKWRTGAEGFLPQGRWEPRRVWALEGVSSAPQYAYSKRVIYLDRETYRIVYTELYDTEGQLWKLVLNGFHFSNRPFPMDQCKADWVFPYVAMEVAVDVQLNHATFCQLPGETPSTGSGWRVNVNKEEGHVDTFVGFGL